MDLLMNYSLKEIILVLIGFSGCVSAIMKIGSSLFNYFSKFFNFSFKKKRKEEKEEEERKELINSINNLNKRFDKLEETVDTLKQSDKDDIKSFITREFHYFTYQKKWIDNFSLQCIEDRYTHYKKYGGNSFIEGFMKELRRLPKEPPTDL